jgi:hypothetical protein
MTDRQAQLALILLREWDPLGIADVDVAPEREYVFEAGGLLDLADSGADFNAIAQLLSERGRELGFPDAQRDERASQAVWEWLKAQQRG